MDLARRSPLTSIHFSRKPFLGIAGVLFCLIAGALAQAQTGNDILPAGCTLPFDAIATKPDPFVQCGHCGVVSKTAKGTVLQAKMLQSQAKNNFCADTTQITVVDFAAMRAMGAQARQNGWETTNLPSRQPLHGFYSQNGKMIGEGDVVRMKAWIMEAHFSDCTAGEEVNCQTPGFVNSDLHVPLVDPSAGGQKQGECTSVTSEISPHFRPASWSSLDLQTPVNNVARITGQLFYDNAHKPCVSPTSPSAPTGDPARSTLWEIHPVYQLEICTLADPSQCDVTSNDGKMWVAYDQWVSDSNNQTATAATGAAARKESACAHLGKPDPDYLPAQCSTGSASPPSSNPTSPASPKKSQ